MKTKRISMDSISKYRSEIYGLSILWIMFFHGYLQKVVYFESIPALSPVRLLLERGNMGVEIFLFISGISLYYSFSKNDNLLSFVKKRVSRLYYPLIFILGPLGIYQLYIKQITLPAFLLRLTGFQFWVNGDQQIWFLSLILVCYLFYPYIYAILYDKDHGENELACLLKTIIMIAAIIGFTLLFGIVAPDRFELFSIAFTRFPIFILGCYFGHLVCQKKSFHWSVVIIFLLMFGICYHVIDTPAIHTTYGKYWYILGGVPITFFFSWIVPFLPSILRKFLRFLGGMTLELYIIHLRVLGLYRTDVLPYRYVEGSKSRFFFTLLVAVIIACIVHYCIEGIKKITAPKKGMSQ